MKRDKKIMILSLVALIVSVLGLSISYAAISKNLKIRISNDYVDANVEFENLKEPVVIGYAKASKLKATNTKVIKYNVSLKKPGDKVIYEFDIANKGNIDMKIEDINIATKYRECLEYKDASISNECKKFDFDNNGYIDSKDTKKYLNIIRYDLYYASNNEKLKVNDILNKKEKKTVKLVIEYLDSASELSETNFVIADSSNPIKIKYVQLIK